MGSETRGLALSYDDVGSSWVAQQGAIVRLMLGKNLGNKTSCYIRKVSEYAEHALGLQSVLIDRV